MVWVNTTFKTVIFMKALLFKVNFQDMANTSNRMVHITKDNSS